MRALEVRYVAEAAAEKATIVMAPFIVKLYLPFKGTISSGQMARVPKIIQNNLSSHEAQGGMVGRMTQC